MAIRNFKASENEFLGLYVNHLHIHEDSIYFLHEEPFLIKWRTINGKHEHFWKIVCKEFDNVHQFLIEESETPNPFAYQVLDDFYPGQHAIRASSYRQDELIIKEVRLLGFKENNFEVVCEIQLQFNEKCIQLNADALVKICTINLNTEPEKMIL